jgi:hypothetical protein
VTRPLSLHFGTLLLLGFVAGATILLGLPAEVLSFSSLWRSSLSMLAAGILVFLLIEILSEATGQTAVALRTASPRRAPDRRRAPRSESSPGHSAA